MKNETNNDSPSTEREKQTRPLSGEVSPEEALSKAQAFASQAKVKMNAAKGKRR